jgi:ferredoxin
MKVVIDKEKCIQCGACAATAPEVFEVDAGEPANLLNEDPKFLDDHADSIRSAAAACPVQAIEAMEDEVPAIASEPASESVDAPAEDGAAAEDAPIPPLEGDPTNF